MGIHTWADGLASALRGNGTRTLMAEMMFTTSHHCFPELEADVWGKVCACMGKSTANNSPETKHSSTAEAWELLFTVESILA